MFIFHCHASHAGLFPTFASFAGAIDSASLFYFADLMYFCLSLSLAEHNRSQRDFTTMVLSLAPTSLADLARDAAAGDIVNEYLDARGIKTPATLALLSRDEDNLDLTLIQPLLQGWPRPDGTTITVREQDKPIAKAVLLHMWMMAKQVWEATQHAAMPKATPTQSTSSTAASTPAEDKVPKALAPGRWTALVQEYQSQQIGGQDRVFPVQELYWGQKLSSPGSYTSMRPARTIPQCCWGS